MSLALVEIAENSIELLAKAAAEADALEVKLAGVQAENQKLKQRIAQLEQQGQSKQASSNDLQLIDLLARTLDQEELLAHGVTVEKMASSLRDNPYQMAGLALTILRPLDNQGLPVKAASTPSPEDQHLVNFEGRTLRDPYGFSKCLQ